MLSRLLMARSASNFLSRAFRHFHWLPSRDISSPQLIDAQGLDRGLPQAAPAMSLQLKCNKASALMDFGRFRL